MPRRYPVNPPPTIPPRPLGDDEACEWLVTYPPSMRVRQTNYIYTREQAEAKFGVGLCEPVLQTRTLLVDHRRRAGLFPDGGGFLSVNRTP